MISLPPKVKFSREEIIAAALDIVREGGMTALTARSLAARLGSSAKPVFGLFENMQEVQNEVMLAANAEYQKFLYTEMMRGIYKPYKASGMAYIAFARKEKELFKLLFMRDRSDEHSDTRDESIADIIALISRNTGLSEEEARLRRPPSSCRSAMRYGSSRPSAKVISAISGPILRGSLPTPPPRQSLRSHCFCGR